MKRIYLIMLMIVAMMVSCNPKDDDHGGGGNNGGITGVYNPEKKISKIVWENTYTDGTEDWRWSGDRLQGIIDEDGYEENFYYNANGKIESYTSEGDEKHIFEYKGNVLSEIYCYDEENNDMYIFNI